MTRPEPAALAVVVPPLGELGQVEIIVLAAAALALSSFFALLGSALLRSVPTRILDGSRDDAERDELRPLLERAETLATSASIFRLAFQFLFIALVFGATSADAVSDPSLESAFDATISLGALGAALAISVPLLVIAIEVVPGIFRGERSDAFLRATLPTFDLVQKPLAALIYGLEGMRRLTMRLLRIPEPPSAVRRIVEDLRDVVQESEREGELEETEREIIENVFEFSDVDVAEVMTPRTELVAVEVEEDIQAVVRAIAETGHSRIPVYEKTLDAIVGVIYAQEVLEVVALGALGSARVRALVQPVGFVPETKRVSEMLGEFRAKKQKLAVVLDEYGGTAGIVTLGDIVSELVGDVREELGEPTPEPIRRRPDGAIEIDGTTRVSEVNEELDLDLPEEEDFDTIAGFALSRLGRFPKPGEWFAWNGLELAVTKANDRRVFEVLLRPTAPHNGTSETVP